MKSRILLPWKLARRMGPVCLVSILALTATAQTKLRLNGAVVLKGLMDPNLAAITQACGVGLELAGNGADNGLLDLVEGRADVAMLSAPLDNVAARINAKKPGAVDVSKLTAITLGVSRILLVVHRDNPLRKLSNQQAVDLLSGKIKNWKEVGGADQGVIVVVAPSGNGTRTAVEKQLLKTESFSTATRVVPNPLQVPLVVSQLPGAIGPLGASVLSDKVAALSLESDIQTEMSFVVRGEPSAEVRKVAEAVKPFIK